MLPGRRGHAISPSGLRLSHRQAGLAWVTPERPFSCLEVPGPEATPQGACRTPGLAEARHPGGCLRHLVLILHVFSLATVSEPRRGQEGTGHGAGWARPPHQVLCWDLIIRLTVQGAVCAPRSSVPSSVLDA